MLELQVAGPSDDGSIEIAIIGADEMTQMSLCSFSFLKEFNKKTNLPFCSKTNTYPSPILETSYEPFDDSQLEMMYFTEHVSDNWSTSFDQSTSTWITTRFKLSPGIYELLAEYSYMDDDGREHMESLGSIFFIP